MFDATDLTTPVTRGELREEFDRFELATKAELEKLGQRMATKAELEKLEARMDQLATKAELKMLEARLEARMDQLATRAELEKLETRLEARMEQLATKTDMEIWGGALLAEIARHTRAVQESMSTQVSSSMRNTRTCPGA